MKPRSSTFNVGLRPTPRLGHSWGPYTPLRSLAGALCAPPLCGNENKIPVMRRITEQSTSSRDPRARY
jgi:hypothetical protein